MSRSILAASAVALILAFATHEAHAGWGSYGGSYGSYGSYGSSGGSYGSSGGSYGSYGSHGGRFVRHHRRVYSSHGSIGWHGSHGSHGSYGSYGSYGSTGSYGSYGGSVVVDCCGSSGGTVTYGAVKGGVIYDGGAMQKGGAVQQGGVYEGEATEMAPVPPTPDAATRNESGQAILTVSVPAEAKVYVNGVLTKSTGSERRYVSRGLTNGYQYTYNVRAEFVRDGDTVEEARVVQMRSGAAEHLAFNFDSSSSTTLTLNVPQDATVTLAGNEVAGQGETRVFTTNKLPAGKVWSDYTIEVSVVRDGQKLSQEKSISLEAGTSQTVSFDFDAPQVASAR